MEIKKIISCLKIFLITGSLFSSVNIYATENLQDKNYVISSQYQNLHIINHPLIQHNLTIMRDKNTSSLNFRQSLIEIAMLMTYEVTRNIETNDIKIETPIEKTTGKVLKEEVVIVPILRAGLGMAEGVHKIIPNADMGHIGLYRDPQTKMPVEYLFKLPKINNQLFIVVDPMLATGNSAIYGVNKLIKAGVMPEKIVFMALVAAPEGVEEFQKVHPKIQIYIAALDRKLNSHAYITPGLGDAGDRLYGTR